MWCKVRVHHGYAICLFFIAMNSTVVITKWDPEFDVNEILYLVQKNEKFQNSLLADPAKTLTPSLRSEIDKHIAEAEGLLQRLTSEGLREGSVEKGLQVVADGMFSQSDVGLKMGMQEVLRVLKSYDQRFMAALVQYQAM
ncbi:MAG: hypothetical protein JWO00_417 [Candidatus Parcubacteria bacterium]|nr:hypothetical protein [Candidatus Parcubacteria bacterium]